MNTPQLLTLGDARTENDTDGSDALATIDLQEDWLLAENHSKKCSIAERVATHGQMQKVRNLVQQESNIFRLT